MHEPAAIPPLVDRDQLIEQHRSYVRALAIKIRQTLPMQVDLQEMIAYGDIGLIEAAERFDPRRGVGFPTFAHYRIRGAIFDGLRDMGFFTRSSTTKPRFTAQANDLLQSAADDQPAFAESAALSVDDQITEAQTLIETLIPAYFLSLENDAIPEIVDHQAMSIEQIERAELIGFVRQMVKELTAEEQQLLDALYFKHRSMTSLAEEMGISKSWISRLHARAIQHLRERMQERGILDAAS